MLNDCDLSDDMLARILETKNNHPSLKNIQLSNNYIEWKDDRITNFFIKNKIETNKSRKSTNTFNATA